MVVAPAARIVRGRTQVIGEQARKKAEQILSDIYQHVNETLTNANSITELSDLACSVQKESPSHMGVATETSGRFTTTSCPAELPIFQSFCRSAMPGTGQCSLHSHHRV